MSGDLNGASRRGSQNLFRGSLVEAIGENGVGQREQRGRYTLVAQAPGSTKVAYELMVDLRVPVIAQLKRRAEKAIISSALHELKKRVEG